MLGIELPILSVGFAGARAELAAAVASAGGFGVLGASGVPPDLLRREVARTRALTDHPFGINIIVAEDPADPEDDRRFFLDSIRAAADADAGAVVPETARASRALGAQGVSRGTRFVASEEASVHSEHKRRIVESTADDTVYTADLYDEGWPDAPHARCGTERTPSGTLPGGRRRVDALAKARSSGLAGRTPASSSTGHAMRPG
jgi:NAD(P)H-dependent flavin oxidoreductase YrpB (nitropropane dioxygenase family)